MLRMEGVADDIVAGGRVIGFKELAEISFALRLEQAGIAPDDYYLKWLLEKGDDVSAKRCVDTDLRQQ